MADLKPVTNIDPNVWYHVTEGRVDNYQKSNFSGMLQIVSDDFLAVFPTTAYQYWQFQPVDGKAGRYAVRCNKTVVSQQLSVCWRQDETDSDRTRLCMATSGGGDEQKWDVANWGDDTYRFSNVNNGSSHNLDVHVRGAAFLSSNINTTVFQSAQHWLMTSLKNVNEGAYSTVFPNVAVSTSTSVTTTQTTLSSSVTSSPSSTSSPDSAGGLPSGAKAGIGIGISLGFIAIALVSFLFYRRRRRGRASAPIELGSGTAYVTNLSSENKSPPPGYKPINGTPPPGPPQEMLHNPRPQEVLADVPHELDSLPLHNYSPPRR